MRATRWLDDAADLLLGHTCLGCGRLGKELCMECLRGLRRGGRIMAGPPPTMAAADYGGLTRTALLAYKEDGHRSLAEPLGTLLADAVVAAGTAWDLHALAVVRVPGHRRPRRGFDALGGILRHARLHLLDHGLTLSLSPALAITSEYAPAKTLGRQARQAQVHHAFEARFTSAKGAPPLLLVDDVCTTGATLREATRALTVAGHRVAGAAVVCAVQPG